MTLDLHTTHKSTMVYQPGRCISVIIVTYNSATVLPAMLVALENVLPSVETIIVDNDSTDATQAIVRNSAVNAILIEGHGNVGFGAGVNIGARAASHDLLVILNPDARPYSIDEHELALLAQKDRVGLRACRVRLDSGKTIHMLHRQWGWRREFYWSVGRSFVKPREIRLARPRVRRPMRAHWAVGAALIVNKQEFHDVGGFDDRFFLYGEDRDLARSYIEHNLPVGPTNAVTVTHDGGASSPRDVVNLTAWGELSLIEYTAKWRGQAVATQMARWCLLALDVFGRLPSTGRLRAISERARAVRARLTDIATQPSISSYPAARQAIADADTRRRKP